MRRATVAFVIALAVPASAVSQQTSEPYTLAPVDLKKRVIWGAGGATPDGFGLAFGGQDQLSEDGRPHTRIQIDGRWQPIADALRAANPLQPFYAPAWALRQSVKAAAAQARYIFFQGAAADEQARQIQSRVLAPLRDAQAALAALTAELPRLAARESLDAYHKSQLGYALEQLGAGRKRLEALLAERPQAPSRSLLEALETIRQALEQGAEALDAEPPARALSPLVYDSRHKMFFLFGGDHLDYLTNDTWLFDPATRRWEQRHPPTAPPPRANHRLSVTEAGRIELSGGYTYHNDIDYLGGPYIDLADGSWSYDMAQNRWSAADGRRGAPDDSRTYRTGLFQPLTYLEGEPPAAAVQEAKLKALPANTWVRTNPPHRPKMNRDWGSAVLDPDRDIMLRYSGGHSAHGGTDVIMYHFATNRWELPFAVEFPLGQTYANFAYPAGYNFNLRPWITAHTYKSYGYDPPGKAMIFTGQRRWFYLFDPALGDWTGRGRKPKALDYDAAYLTLTCHQTPGGLVCWTALGEVFRYDARNARWNRLELTGEKLIGAQTDHSGIVYDSKRNRLLFVPKSRGRVYSLDLERLTVASLRPDNAKNVGLDGGFFRELVYLPQADLAVILSATLPPEGEERLRRTLAYDAAANRWVSLKLAGPNPAGPQGRNVSLGAMYDGKRDLLWATDAASQVYVLRLDPRTADIKPR